MNTLLDAAKEIAQKHKAEHTTAGISAPDFCPICRLELAVERRRDTSLLNPKNRK